MLQTHRLGAMLRPSQPPPPLPATNLLLDALPAADAAALRAGLEDVQLAVGQALFQTGDAMRHVYFPRTAIVSLTASMRNGATAEVASVGREGLVGICALMGRGEAVSSAVVQAAGLAWKLPAEALRQAAQHHPTLMQALLGYTQALFAQMAQTSACSRHHALEQQLCRWLLLHLDRLPGDEMAMTQERMAHLLGVRREGVTMAALRLQKAGLLSYSRGRLTVLDRVGLQQRSCECYAVVRTIHDRLHPPAARPQPGGELRAA